MQRFVAFLALALLASNLHAFFVGPPRVMVKKSNRQLDIIFDLLEIVVKKALPKFKTYVS
jgi:hypothetical protein